MKNDKIDEELINSINGKTFYLDADRVVIKKRKNGLEVKPPLYLFNLSKICYISSLIPTAQKNVFNFDIRHESKTYKLTLNSDGTISTELIA